MTREPDEFGVIWEQVPLEQKKFAMIRILRVPTGGKLVFRITSEKWIGCYTHWVAGRTQPHTVGECEGCKAKTALRWKGWIAGVSERNEEHAVIEFPEGTVYAFQDWLKQKGTLRGYVCRMQRQNSKPNSKLVVSFSLAKKEDPNFPEELPVGQILEHMWERGWDQVDKSRLSPALAKARQLDVETFNGED